MIHQLIRLSVLTIIFTQAACERIGDGKTEQGQDMRTVEYYSTIALRESPYPAFKGVVRLSREEAMKRNHYRFTYDKSYRLSSVSFWLEDRLRRPNHTANYFFTAPLQKINYDQNREIITYYDRFGNPITQRGAHRSVYLLDEEGRRMKLHFEDDAGNIIENNWGISRYEWSRQNDGSILESRYDLRGDPRPLRPQFDFYRIRLFYDETGLLALMQNIEEDGDKLKINDSGVAQDQLLFDRRGKWLGWNVLDDNHQLTRGNGPNVARGINTSNAYGYETGIRYEGTDGSPIINSHGFWGSKRYYDPYGNYDYTHFIDSLGNPGINFTSGYCYAFYTFDEGGYNRLKIELMDVDKNLVLHKQGGYAVIQYEYDEFDQLIKTQYLGINEESINRKDNGVAWIEYQYNDDHALVKSIRFDRSGKSLDSD